MAQAATEEDDALPITLLKVLDHEGFLIQKIPPKATSSMVLCEQWPYRSPQDEPNIVIPIQIELIDKNKDGLWMYLKRKKKDSEDEYETYLHFKLDRELPTVEQAYDSSRYFQLSIPKPGGSKNEMIYLGLRDDSKQLQDEINTYWRALDSALEVQQMPEEDWTLGDDTQIAIGKGGGTSEQKVDNSSNDKKNQNVLPLAAPKSKPKKDRKKKKAESSNNNSSNDPKKSAFDSFTNDFDAAFGNIEANTNDSSNNANEDNKDKSDANANASDNNNNGQSGWTDFDF